MHTKQILNIFKVYFVIHTNKKYNYLKKKKKLFGLSRDMYKTLLVRCVAAYTQVRECVHIIFH